MRYLWEDPLEGAYSAGYNAITRGGEAQSVSNVACGASRLPSCSAVVVSCLLKLPHTNGCTPIAVI